jgi:magnesium chelatase family protein
MVTQAHRGILFLDEAPEFATNVLDALRQPLESKRVILSRRTFTVELPANFQLVIAANPCPCGYSFVRDGSCHCTPMQKRRYLGRISGPLLDRIDIRVVVDPVAPVIITEDGDEESSASIQQRVIGARQKARERLKETPWSCNADVPGPQLREMFGLSAQAAATLSTSSQNSARGIDRIAKVAWTVADLRSHDSPTVADVEVAQQLRNAGGRWAA